jgi:hypothetical protein
MSGLSPSCAPKRMFANASGFTGSRPNRGFLTARKKFIFDIATTLDQPYSPYRPSRDATTIFPAMPAHQTRRDCLTGKSVNVLSSPVAKNNSLHPSGKSSLQARVISPERGAARDRHETRGGMRWTRQRRRATGVCRAGHPVSEQPARGRTALQCLRQDFDRRHMAGRGLGRGCCGRRSRVVLASVADVKLAEAASSQPGFDRPSIRSATVTKRNSSPGRARRKPLKPLRGESRVISGVLVVTIVCLLPMHTGCGCSGHPAFPAPSPFRGQRFCKTSDGPRREIAGARAFGF